jgi:hypothetical protein
VCEDDLLHRKIVRLSKKTKVKRRITVRNVRQQQELSAERDFPSSTRRKAEAHRKSSTDRIIKRTISTHGTHLIRSATRTERQIRVPQTPLHHDPSHALFPLRVPLWLAHSRRAPRGAVATGVAVARERRVDLRDGRRSPTTARRPAGRGRYRSWAAVWASVRGDPAWVTIDVRGW